MNLVHHHPLSLFFPPTLLHNLQTMKTTKSETRKKKKRERLLRLLLYIVLYIFIVSSCHTYVSVQHLSNDHPYIHPLIIIIYIYFNHFLTQTLFPLSPLFSSTLLHTHTYALSITQTHSLTHIYTQEHSQRIQRPPRRIRPRRRPRQTQGR